MHNRYTQLISGLRIYRDVINVGVLQRNGRVLLIGCGEGKIFEQSPLEKGGRGLSVRPENVDWILMTHHHRDEAAGLAPVLEHGVRLAVPAKEQYLFDAVETFWANDTVWRHNYNFHPSPLSLRQSVPVARALSEGDIFEWQGLTIEVLETPGHTLGSVTYIIDFNKLPSWEGPGVGSVKVAFVGDMLYGPGQLWDFHSLQGRLRMADGSMTSEYHGFGENSEQLLIGLEKILQRKPDFLVPSHGVVIEQPESAVAQLRENIEACMANYRQLSSGRWYFWTAKPDWQAVRDSLNQNCRPLPPWVLEFYGTSRAIVADDGTVFLIDCAGECPKKIAELQKQGKMRAVEGVWITHYHDDHVGAVNDVRSQQNCSVYAHECMVDILRNPKAYYMPCLDPNPITVDKIVKTGETWQWKDFRLTAYDFPGQSYYDAALLVERDGFSVLFTGDSLTPGGIDDYCAQNRNLLGEGVGFDRCLALLDELRPDLLVNEHVAGAFTFSPAELHEMQAMFRKREALFGKLFPWDHPNYGLDPQWIRCYPYTQVVKSGSEVHVEICVLNHSDIPHTASVAIRLPEGWKIISGCGEKQIPSKTEGRISLSVLAPATFEHSRHIVGCVVQYDDLHLGEIVEAIVDIEP
ncbi:MBL fold metallo-hydrolase [Candidatus Poribacteria bacterium]|nr:MBL fold metallo-hydrolase [Candidatus Poribacteria bacterium]